MKAGFFVSHREPSRHSLATSIDWKPCDEFCILVLNTIRRHSLATSIDWKQLTGVTLEQKAEELSPLAGDIY